MNSFGPEVLAAIERHANDYLAYDAETGEISWRQLRSGSRLRPGEPAGRVSFYGYKEMTFKLLGRRVTVKLHRLAWFMHYREWPKGAIDHIDHVKTNNRISNLRVVTDAENMMNTGIPANNTSGHIGVTWSKAAKKWQAQFMKKGRMYYLGVFLSKDAAAEVVRLARLEGGFHGNHGVRGGQSS